MWNESALFSTQQVIRRVLRLLTRKMGSNENYRSRGAACFAKPYQWWACLFHCEAEIPAITEFATQSSANNRLIARSTEYQLTAGVAMAKNKTIMAADNYEINKNNSNRRNY